MFKGSPTLPPSPATPPPHLPLAPLRQPAAGDGWGTGIYRHLIYPQSECISPSISLSLSLSYLSISLPLSLSIYINCNKHVPEFSFNTG